MKRDTPDGPRTHQSSEKRRRRAKIVRRLEDAPPVRNVRQRLLDRLNEVAADVPADFVPVAPPARALPMPRAGWVEPMRGTPLLLPPQLVSRSLLCPLLLLF